MRNVVNYQRSLGLSEIVLEMNIPYSPHPVKQIKSLLPHWDKLTAIPFPTKMTLCAKCLVRLALQSNVIS